MLVLACPFPHPLVLGRLSVGEGLFRSWLCRGLVGGCEEGLGGGRGYCGLLADLLGEGKSELVLQHVLPRCACHIWGAKLLAPSFRLLLGQGGLNLCLLFLKHRKPALDAGCSLRTGEGPLSRRGWSITHGRRDLGSKV